MTARGAYGRVGGGAYGRVYFPTRVPSDAIDATHS